MFAGRDNCFNRKFIAEMSVEHEIVCCLFLEPDRGTTLGRVKKIGKRVTKYGLIRAFDELAFHVFDRLFLRKREKEFYRNNPDFFIGNTELSCPVYNIKNIHDEKCLKMIKEIAPDIIFSICSHILFEKSLYKIPRLGTFVLHEGITPEYRGLHTCLWALMKREYQYVGYTVLKVNSQIDSGEILLQGQYNFNAKENYKAWSWVGHNALIYGLQDIIKSFRELERDGEFVPIKKENRPNYYYTWMRLSEFLFLYMKNYFFKEHKFQFFGVLKKIN